MTIKNASPVRSMNSGEFSPDALGRIDIKQYYSAHKRMKGFEPLPQGGYQLMGGTRYVAKARSPLGVLPITGITTDTSAKAVGTHIVWSGSVAGLVSVVNVAGMVASGGPITYQVEANTISGWVVVGSAFGPWLTAADRTAGFPPQEGRIATGLRIRATVTIGGTSITIGAVVAMSEVGDVLIPHHVALTTDDDIHFVAMITSGIIDFIIDEGFVGCAYLPATTSAMIGDLSDYAEADTIGLFHPSSIPTQRIRNFGKAHEWGVDAWPFDTIPKIDLGGDYAKTADVWEITISWATNGEVFLSVIVDGERIPDLALRDRSTAAVISISTANAAPDNWAYLAERLQSALENLPSLGTTITVSQAVSTGGFRRFTIVFAGDLAGQEFQVTSTITNTVNASANAVHTVIGKTDGEPLFSALRGYPGLAEEVQSRMVHGRIPAASAALVMSRAGEVFDLNIEAQNDAAARLDRIRSKTNETVLAVKESKYILLFTDRAPYFITNRTIERNTPLNFVKTGDVGIRKNSRALDLDGLVYYISSNGEQHISLAYDDVSTAYSPNTESMLSNHLTTLMLKQVRQRAERDNDASSIWIAREDGRLIKAQLIRNQEITGYCEWLVSQGGKVHAMSVDGANRLWLTISRNGLMTHELYDRSTFLQGVVTKTCDFSGVVVGLEGFIGEVWAYADGHTLGPFTVDGGKISLGDFFDGPIEIGTWVAPVAETMPMPFVTGNDDIIFRPGRIHTAHLNLISSTSLAVAANGEPLTDVPLLEAYDPVNMSMPRKTRLMTVYGLLGQVVGPTLTVSQIRPGWLRVRDLALAAKL